MKGKAKSGRIWIENVDMKYRKTFYQHAVFPLKIIKQYRLRKYVTIPI